MSIDQEPLMTKQAKTGGVWDGHTNDKDKGIITKEKNALDKPLESTQMADNLSEQNNICPSLT